MEYNLNYLKRYGSIVVVASALLHNIIFSGLETLFITAILLYGWFLIVYFVVRSSNVIYYPVSTIMICGLMIIHFFLPMPLMLLEGKPMSYNLRVPYETFAHHGIFVTTVVFTHVMYTWMFNGGNPFRSILVRTEFYSQPTDSVIWVTSFAGLFSILYNFFVFGVLSSESSDRGFLYYVSSVLAQYVWMPVIIIFSKFRGHNNVGLNKNIFYIALYVFVVLVVSISSNMRTLLFSGIIIAFSLTFIGFLLGFYHADKIFSLKKFLVVGVGGFLVGGVFLDFGYAMIAVRGDRANISAGELISQTIKVFNDDELLNSIKLTVEKKGGGSEAKNIFWDEKYFNNIIINRYVNFKISDNSIYYAGIVGHNNFYMAKELGDQAIALLPNVVLRFLDFDVVKKMDIASYSIGDYLYSLAVGTNNFLGAFVISSMPGVGLSIFGFWYPVVVATLFLVIFPMFDSMAININGRVYFSYYFFASVVLIFNYFNDHHVYVFEIKYIFRTYFESIALFLLTMYFFKSVVSSKKL